MKRKGSCYKTSLMCDTLSILYTVRRGNCRIPIFKGIESNDYLTTNNSPLRSLIKEAGESK